MARTLTGYLTAEDGLVFRHLTDALCDMLGTRSIDALSTSDLIKRAGVGRASFYRLFRDKYDLACAIHARVLQGTLERYFEGVSFRDAAYAVFDAFTAHKRFYRGALTSSDINALGNFIFTQTYLFYERALQRAGFAMDRHQARILRQYAFGSVALLSEWILGDMDEPLFEYMEASLSGLPDFVRPYLLNP